MPSMVELEFARAHLRLLPDRAAWWRSEHLLLIADPHFGKADVFRRAGVPVPDAATTADLARLSRLLDDTAAARLIILGDFFHDTPAEGEVFLATLRKWRDRHRSVSVTLVPGNHDRRVETYAAAIDMAMTGPSIEVAGVTLIHHPPEAPETPTIAGHVHPGARLVDFDGTSARVPCFAATQRLLLLPAFGKFTGTKVIDRTADTRLFAVAANRVVEAA